MSHIKKIRKGLLVILPLEKFAGKFDIPSNDNLAEAEAAELNELPGGRFTFSATQRRARRSSAYEREALRLRATALAHIK